jgi:uncharacterized protein
LRKKLWIICGTVCVGLALLGIFLPVLPTTPFLLLAAYCFGRGSERFYHWLVDRSRLGVYIRSYREGRGIPLKQKILTIALLWVTIGFAIGFAAQTWWLKALLAAIAVGVTFHLSKIKTWKPDLVDQVDPANSIPTEIT